MAPGSMEIIGHETHKIQVSKGNESEVRWGIKNVLDFTAKAQ